MRWTDRIGRRLKLHDLHILMAVAQQGSMAKAARELAVSQPVVSKTISDLERTVGAKLLDRTRYGVEPTLYGRALVKRSNAIFDELRQSIRELESLADPTVGELAIGCSESISSGMLPSIIDQFSQRCPRVILDLDTADTGILLGKLRDRSLDLMLARTGEDIWVNQFEADLNLEVLFNDELVVAAGAKHRCARSRKIELSALANERWIFGPPNTWSHKVLTAAFRACGLSMPEVSLRTLSVHARTSLLTTGQFVTVLPISILRHDLTRLPITMLPVELPADPWPVAVVTLKNRTLGPVAERFLECARAVAKTISTEPAQKPTLRR